MDTELVHEDTISNESVPPHSTTINLDSSNLLLSTWKGFKLVGGNSDRNVHASYQQIGHTTVSALIFMCMLCWTVLISLVSLIISLPLPFLIQTDLLPSDDDIALLKRDMSVLISR